MDLDRTPRVLVVDDEASVLESYELFLDGECDVETVSNGGEALVELGPDVDVVLLDRRMPGMSGDDVLEHIRDWELDCRVVMVSAVDPGIEDLELSYDQYVTKPTSADELLGTVEQVLLLDRYERLVSEYHEAKKKVGLYRSEFTPAELDGQSGFERLTDRAERLGEEIDETLAAFDDEEFVEVLRGGPRGR